MRKLWIVIIVVVVLGALGAGGRAFMKRRAKGAMKPITVRIEQPALGTLVEYVSAPGEYARGETVEQVTGDRRAAKVPGRPSAVHHSALITHH